MSAPLLATTSTGRLRGCAVAHHVTAFLGIPYAAPPLGPRRFAPPSAPESWEGVRPADRHGPAPIQGAPAPGRFLADLSSPEQSEDCLYLSVWTPDRDAAARLPVMVWFYGGAFVAGSTQVPAYDGARLASAGVVVVSVNYRLGIFGWLRAGELGADGNQGLADQSAALAWVQREISAFGGDPDNVTLFGESAGAASIALHLAAHRPSSGSAPYRRAVLQSGSFNLVSSIAEAEDTAGRVLRHLGVSAATLRELPTAALRAAQDEATPRSGGVFYRPVADGDRVPVDPAATLARQGPPVAVLCGTNRHEMGFFWGREERFDTLEDAFVLALAARWHHDPEALVATYRSARAGRGEPVDNRAVAVAIGTDWTFRAASMALAGWQAGRAGAHAYRLDWCSPLYDGLVGAAHVLDVPLVFGTFDHHTVAQFSGFDRHPDEVTALSAAMAAAWVAFATHGDPGWAPYDLEQRTTRIFGGTSPTEVNPEGIELALWEPLLLRR